MLPMVLAVTAFDHANAGTILITHGQAVWDYRPTQTKCLINSHLFHDSNVTVDKSTLRDRGKKRLVVDNIEIKLDFVDNKTLSFNI